MTSIDSHVAGFPFPARLATIEDGLAHLPEIGRRILRDGAQDVSFEAR
jgi:hypothetical protein